MIAAISPGVSILSYQHEKLQTAVSVLGSLTMKAVDRIEGAMLEFSIAFHEKPTPAGGEDHVQKIRAIMEGAGTFRERAAALSEHELDDLSRAFFGLYGVVSQAYWEAGRSA
ncbi:MAG: hypothetical protein ABSA52_00930 [Candidatus Binatia bacterium]|jgi:hypothetical protein